MRNFRYHAFISYSHAADGQLAPALQSGLQRFAKPWYRLRAIRVFRDETGLAVTPELWESIERALEESAYFILLASAKSAESKWVEQEVDWWLRNRTPDRLLIVWTDGELTWDSVCGDFDWTKTRALPQRLEKAFLQEPLYLDFRWARTAKDLSLRSPQFLGAVARLSATLQDKPLDELIGDDVNRHSTVQRLLRFAVIALAVVAVGAVFAAVSASQARKLALRLAEEANARERQAAIEKTWADQRLKELKEQQDSQAEQARQLVEDAKAKEKQAGIEKAQADQKLKEFKDQQEFQAEQERKTRVSRQLANRALTVLPLDRELGILLASEAVRTMATTEAEDALRRSLFEARMAESVLKGHTGAVYTINFSGDGKRLITGSADKTAQIWETATGKPLVKLIGHEDVITHTGFSSDGKRVFTASKDKSVRFWDAATGNNLVTMLHEDSIRSLQLSSDGKSMLTACSHSQEPELWDVVGGKKLVKLPGRFSAKFSPDGKRIAVANPTRWGNGIAICDAEKGTVLVEMMGRHTNVVWEVAFSPDGQTIASASADQTACLWETVTGQELHVLQGHQNSVDGVAFSPDGRLVLTLGRDAIVQIWEVATGRNVAKLRGHEDSVPSAVFSPNGKWILTASWDKTAIIWDASNGRKVAKLAGHPERLATAAFSPEGRQVITASWDGVARLFDCDVCGSVEDLLKLAAKRVTRSLTPEERQKYLTESATATK